MLLRRDPVLGRRNAAGDRSLRRERRAFSRAWRATPAAAAAGVVGRACQRTRTGPLIRVFACSSMISCGGLRAPRAEAGPAYCALLLGHVELDVPFVEINLREFHIQAEHVAIALKRAAEAGRVGRSGVDCACSAGGGDGSGRRRLPAQSADAADSCRHFVPACRQVRPAEARGLHRSGPARVASTHTIRFPSAALPDSHLPTAAGEEKLPRLVELPHILTRSRTATAKVRRDETAPAVLRQWGLVVGHFLDWFRTRGSH